MRIKTESELHYSVIAGSVEEQGVQSPGRHSKSGAAPRPDEDPSLKRG